MERIKREWDGDNVPCVEDFDQLIALARRGAGLTLYRQKLFVDRDGSEWVDEYYSRRVSLPPPPEGEQG